MAHSYAAFGLQVLSELEFPELLGVKASLPDLHVRVGPVQPGISPEPGAENWIEFHGSSHETLCTFEGVGRFLVRGDSEIIVDAHPNADPAFVRHALLGPVIAPVLWRRDLFTLHASVIDVGGRCVAFVGVSGEGKSTTGAALYARGHTLVSDDLGAIAWSEDLVRVRPGFPRLRVFADSLRGIGEEPTDYPLVHAEIDKRSKHAERFARAPVPLDRIFVLAPGDAFEALLLPKREAMMELMRHSYSTRSLIPSVGFGPHMKMAASVAERVPVYLLRRPRDLSRLKDLVAFVERELSV